MMCGRIIQLLLWNIGAFRTLTVCLGLGFFGLNSCGIFSSSSLRIIPWQLASYVTRDVLSLLPWALFCVMVVTVLHACI